MRMVWHWNVTHAPPWPHPCCSPAQIMEMCLRTGAIRNTKAFLGEMTPLAFQLTGEEPPVVVTQTKHEAASTALACMLACFLHSSLSEPCLSATVRQVRARTVCCGQVSLGCLSQCYPPVCILTISSFAPFDGSRKVLRDCASQPVSELHSRADIVELRLCTT